MKKEIELDIVLKIRSKLKKKKKGKNLPLPMLRALKHSNPNPFFKQINQHYIYKSINLKRKKNSPYIQFCITNNNKNLQNITVFNNNTNCNSLSFS